MIVKYNQVIIKDMTMIHQVTMIMMKIIKYNNRIMFHLKVKKNNMNH